MKRVSTLILALATALAPGWASAWWAYNRHEVLPVSNGVFEVVSEVGSGAQQFWCAAGDYAYRALGAAAAQRIYIVRAIGPSQTRPGRKSVQFSLVPPPGADTEPRLSLSVKAVGDNLRAAAAQQYCFGNGYEDPFLRRF